MDDRSARRRPPAAALKARLRSSPRVVALYRGARGFVLGGKDRDATGRGRSAVEDGVRLLPRAGLTPSPRTGVSAEPGAVDPGIRADVRRDPDRSRLVRGGRRRRSGAPDHLGRGDRAACRRAARRLPGRPVWGGPLGSAAVRLARRARRHACRACRRRLHGHVLDDRRPRWPDPPMAGRHQRIGAATLRLHHPGLRAGVLSVVRAMDAGSLDLCRCRGHGRHLQHLGPARLLPCDRDRVRDGVHVRAAIAADPPAGDGVAAGRPLADDRGVRTTGHAAERLSGHHRRSPSVARRRRECRLLAARVRRPRASGHRPRGRQRPAIDREARHPGVRVAAARVGDRRLADDLAAPELSAPGDGAPRPPRADEPVCGQGSLDLALEHPLGRRRVGRVDRRVRWPSCAAGSRPTRRSATRGRRVAPTTPPTSHSSRSRPSWPPISGRARAVEMRAPRRGQARSQ